MKGSYKTAAACVLFSMCLVYHVFIAWLSRALDTNLPSGTTLSMHWTFPIHFLRTTNIYLIFFFFLLNLLSGSKNKKPQLGFRPDSVFTSYFKSPEAKRIYCHRTNKFYDLCLINGRTVMDPTTSTFYLADSTSSTHQIEKIRPYPRKWELGTMRDIREITLTAGQPSPPCKVQHNAPALVFSAGEYITVGGLAGNFFHEFNDGMFPVYVTVNSIFSDDQDFVFVVTDARDVWFNKFSDLLQAYGNKYPIINLDNETSTHCFTSVGVGLVTHGMMTIRPRLMPMSKTVFHFRAFLDKAYGQRPNTPPKPISPKTRPRLALTRRSVGRVLLNHNELKSMAQEIGFEVIEFQPTPKTPLRECYAIVNPSHAVVGVHGAALTHTVFLRPGTVFLQVVPLGVDMGADIFFGDYARAIGLEYMEYKIRAEESTLIEKYDKNSLLIKDPDAYFGSHPSVATNDLYFKKQDVRLDLVRFREYLMEVYEKAKKFMAKEG